MLQIRSVEEPFKSPELVGPTLGVLKRADAMGLVKKTIGRLDYPAFRESSGRSTRRGLAGTPSWFSSSPARISPRRSRAGGFWTS